MLKLTDTFNELVLGRSKLCNTLQRLAIRLIVHFGPTRRAMTARLTGIGIRYPRDGHPLTGHRVPDVDCAGTRLYESLREGRFVLLTTPTVATPNRQYIVHCVHSDPELPAAVLVRPDGYVAWAANEDVTTAQITGALEKWCGTTERIRR